MSTENTPSETQEIIREIAAIFKNFTEAEDKATRLMGDIEKEEKAEKCETR